MATKKRIAHVHIIPQPITVDETAINEALRRFDAPYALVTHAAFTSEDGVKAHQFEVCAWCNEIFLFELIQWQLFGLVTIESVEFMRPDEDHNLRWMIYATDVSL
jgi:hypothetical protein